MAELRWVAEGGMVKREDGGTARKRRRVVVVSVLCKEATRVSGTAVHVQDAHYFSTEAAQTPL